jgi:hypothetical protein
VALLIKKAVFLMAMLIAMPMVTLANSTQIINQNITGILENDWCYGGMPAQPCIANDLWIGISATSYIKFNGSMVSIPYGNIIQTAYVDLYFSHAFDSNMRIWDQAVEYCANQTWSDNWTDNAGCQAIYSYTTYNTSSLNSYIYWDVTDLIINATNNGDKNMTFAFIYGDTGDTAVNQFLSTNSNNNPQLIINYINYTNYTALDENHTSYVHCLTNDIIYGSEWDAYNGVYYQHNASYLCDNGCDSVTNQCLPLSYESDLMNILIIALIIIIIALLYEWGRR